MNTFELRQYSLLFLTAVIWGSGFIGQKLGMDHVSPYTFTFMRTFIGGVFLIPVIIFIKKRAKARRIHLRKSSPKALFWGSFFCGLCLIAAESFQQFGLQHTDVSKASFITSLYVIFVPIISVFLGQKPSLKTVICVILAAVGLYLLCIKNSLTLEFGDLLVLICALIFAVHILVIAYFVQRCDGLENFLAAAPAFIYCGIMSNGVAYTLQIVGQRGVNAVIATIILSLESVMGTIFGVLLLGDHLSSRQLTGCILMFAAVVFSQIPVKTLLCHLSLVKRKQGLNDKI